MICIICIIVNRLVLLGRVYAGQCGDDVDIWQTQTCNSFAKAGPIPPDQVMIIYLSPIVSQLVVRGISAAALVASCLMGVGFVAIAGAHVGGGQQIWTLSYSTFFIIFMMEELTRTTFMQGQAMIAASAASYKQELVLMEISAIVEKKSKEKEVHQLKSLIGNVAHNLKTPLHSIEADLEMVRMFISKIPKAALEISSEDFKVNWIKKNIDVFSILNSLKASCQFMGMSINRSQDFMKSSNNIALVPQMEAFELKSALDMLVTCLNHLDSGKSITLHPIPDDICPQIISDKHWISENALCLLSNAVKYSDDGCIDVRMKLIDVPIEAIITPPSHAPREEMDEIRVSNRTAGGSADGDVYITLYPDVNQTEKPLRGFQVQDTRLARTGSVSGTESPAGTRQMLTISVEDNGIGIPEEKRKQLFQPFAQAQRMAGGTGLGLYSLAKRMEALGVECGVSGRSDGRQGSMFWFTFPYRPDESRRDTTSEDNSQLSSLTDMMKPKHILIIDDSLSILIVTARMLKMHGHTIATATNGSIGLKMMQQAYTTQEYDMILTDIQMPVMDGIEATRRYREFEDVQMQLEKKKNGNCIENNGTCRNESKSSNDFSLNNVDDALTRDDYMSHTQTNITNIIDNNNVNNNCNNDWSKKCNNCGKIKRSRMLIIGLSANSDSLTEQESIDCGMDYFLSKPFAYRRLLPIFEILHGNSQSI